jgi:dCTP diphosphatase
MTYKSDSQTNLGDIRKLVQEFVQQRNWSQFHTPKSLAIAISIEAAELLEHFLFRKEDTIPSTPDKIESFTDEMADIFIYLLSLANILDVKDFSQIIYQKMEKNRQKYPMDRFSGENYRKQ